MMSRGLVLVLVLTMVVVMVRGKKAARPCT
jgi:hypothetical protein